MPSYYDYDTGYIDPYFGGTPYIPPGQERPYDPGRWSTEEYAKARQGKKWKENLKDEYGSYDNPYSWYLSDQDKATAALEQLLKERGVHPAQQMSLRNERGGTYGSRETWAPEIREDVKPLVDAVQSIYEQRLAQESALPPGYKEAGLRGIEQAGAAEMNRMAAAKVPGGYNLAGDPANIVARDTAGKSLDFEAGLRQKESDLRNEDRMAAQAVLDTFRTGGDRSEQGTYSQNDTTTLPPNLRALIAMREPSQPMPYQEPESGPDWMQTGLALLGAGMSGYGQYQQQKQMNQSQPWQGSSSSLGWGYYQPTSPSGNMGKQSWSSPSRYYSAWDDQG